MLGGVPSRNEIPHVRVESDPQVYPRGNIAARWYISKVRGRRPLKGSLLQRERISQTTEGKEECAHRKNPAVPSRRGSAVFLTRALVWGSARDPFPSVDRY